jgi:small subunit ribosomal protein S4
MLFQKKNRFKPLYKKFVNVSENIKNSQKILKLKKKKWIHLINILNRKLKKYNKYKSYNQLQYLVSRNPNKWNSYKQGRYRNIVQTYKKFKLFYGHLNKKKIKILIKKTIRKSKTTNNINLNFLNLFESRLDVVLYRTKFCKSIRTARQLISHNGVLVNNNKVNNSSFTLKNGDFVKINNKYHKLIEKNLATSNIWPIPPKHLTINYKTLQLIYGTIDSNNLSIYLNFNLNLEKLIVDFMY